MLLLQCPEHIFLNDLCVRAGSQATVTELISHCFKLTSGCSWLTRRSVTRRAGVRWSYRRRLPVPGNSFPREAEARSHTRAFCGAVELPHPDPLLRPPASRWHRPGAAHRPLTAAEQNQPRHGVLAPTPQTRAAFTLGGVNAYRIRALPKPRLGEVCLCAPAFPEDALGEVFR